LSGAELLALAASLENESDHLIAAEITREAARRQLQPPSVEGVEVSENGVSGVVTGKKIKIGSRGFLAAELEAGPDLAVAENRPEHSLVFMSYAGRVCGVFVFGDELKPNSIPAVSRLHGAGYRVALVSGDDDQTTKAIAKEVEIDEALQQQGQLVAMVGDGINDAPALVQADLAIAVHSGSDLGKEAADLTLMRGDLLQLWDFVLLAKEVKKKIHQNLGFSFIYNLVSIPIAMGGLLTPLIAVSAMLLSSLSVIGNTLLLLKKA
jgi:P-type E1-E2 ATPase